MTRRRVLITGVGVVSALGNDLGSFERRLLGGESGVRLVRRGVGGAGGMGGASGGGDSGRSGSSGDSGDSGGSGGSGDSGNSGNSNSSDNSGERSIEVCAAAADFDPAAHFNKMELISLDRVSQMAVIAARQALGQWEGSDAARRATGVYMGCAMGGSTQIETTYEDLFVARADRVRPVTVVNVMANAAAAHIALRHHLHGANLTFSNACSSSAVAIGEACRAIRHGYLDAVAAGGSEALLVFGSLHGWQALGTLARPTADPRAACRPFAADRTGLVLGEGAAVVLLESEAHALRRGAPILGEVLGYGTNCDAAHLTRPDAASQAQAMRAALDDAGIDATAIDYINAHGTATLAGDVSESDAIKAVFGAHGPPVSATKAGHGHTLGAAGALELIACLCALRTQRLPPTLNLDRLDPACSGLDHVPHSARAAAVDRALSNSFAFGGSNATLVVGAYSSDGSSRSSPRTRRRLS